MKGEVRGEGEIAESKGLIVELGCVYNSLKAMVEAISLQASLRREMEVRVMG